MPSWSGKTRGGKTGYKLFVISVKHLGLPFAYFILRFVVVYFFIFSPKSTSITYRYFRHRIKFSVIKSIIKTWCNYYIFGQTLIDKMALLAGFKTRLTFVFDGENYLQKMSDDKTGGLLISAHIGNFEAAGHLLKRLKTKVSVLMLGAEHEKIKQYLSNVYTEIGINIIQIKNDYSHIHDVKNAFDNKEIVCMLGDRFPERVKTFSAKFLDKKAMFPAGPFYMAMKYDVPVSFVFGMKEKKYSYHFYASKPKVYYQPQLNLKTRELSAGEIINDYIAALEKALLKYPEQWFNYYDFWEEEKHRYTGNKKKH